MPSGVNSFLSGKPLIFVAPDPGGVTENRHGKYPLTIFSRLLKSQALLLSASNASDRLIQTVTRIRVNPKRQTRAELLAEITDLRNRLAEREMVEAKQTRLECELAERTEELEERIKELNCLYAISRLLEQKRLSLDEIVGKTVEIIPKTLMFDGRRCARILLDGRTFETKNFFESPRRQSCPIVVSGDRKGLIEIRYLREGDYLNKEKQLLAAIAELLERIIEQKQTEKSLVESEKRFRSLVENSPTGIFIVQDGHIIYENPEEQRMSGPLAQLFDRGDVDNIHSEDIAKVKQGYEDMVSGKITNFDLDFRFFQWSDDESDLDVKWVVCRASRIEYLGKEAILVNKLDVTRVKELEHLLRVEDKMASLGRVASGIAHEIRNPLSGINIYVSNLEKIMAKGGSPQKGKEILKQIQTASNQIEAVIRRVMDFARPSEPRIVMTDLNRVIEETIHLSAVALDRNGIELDKKLSYQLPSCPVDPHLIGQVLLNLITNAVEALKDMAKTRRIIEVTSFLAGEYVNIKISDSGPGVPLQLRKKIFDPFYSTKDGSTGIGLSISHRIVADHGGFLSVASGKWGGSEFKIEIPLQKGGKWVC
jgi:PAS domain S-box-containing protein